jgi:hypothetical protein
VKARRSLCFPILTGSLIIFVCVCLVGSLLVIQYSPAVGAYGADFLRKIVGDRIVVELETTLFKLEDGARNLEYSLGLAPAASPWSVPATATPVIPTATSRPAVVKKPTGTPAPTLPLTGVIILPTSTAEPAWMPPQVTPLGVLLGVAVWEPFIQDAQGRTVAYRTFVQPDADRPYALTGIVAFNLEYTRLHFVLGFADPYADGIAKKGTGKIPAQDLEPGRLLAAFNGGFKYEHGAFGAMADGYTSAPPRNGLGTLSIYQDGHVRMGVWGEDISASREMVAFRQNGPLVIQNGTLNKAVDDPTQWGYTVSGGTVTWRSGVAISQDGKTLYYFAGQYSDITSLSRAMQTVNPQTAMQLDINNFWVHFTAFKDDNGTLAAEALFPKEMSSNLERFLNQYPRDFFYVTTP